MAEDISARAAWAFADAVRSLIPESGSSADESLAVVSNVEKDGSVWVRLLGSDDRTPVNGNALADASVGDLVSVRIADGRLSITGNASTPAVGQTQVLRAVEPVDIKANNALLDAQRANIAANIAEEDAKRAHDAADDAADAASAAQTSANMAHDAADDAADAASAAQTSANMAHAEAIAAQNDANVAHGAAVQAQTSADSALASANSANRSANDALTQLSVVQDVIGTVTWLAEHGTYQLTNDMTVDPDKTYYVRVMPMEGYLCDHLGNALVTGDGERIAIASVAHSDGWLYLPVAEPTDSALAVYYELTVDEAMSHYVASHLALTSAGLWVLKDEEAYRLLVAADGVSVVDPSGHTVATYGESIRFDAARPQYIGGEDAYIVYYDTDDDGRPDSIRIGGRNVSIGDDGRSLSDVLADVAQASDDARAALDSATLAIISTNGQLFRNGAESTVLQVAVFPAGGSRLDTIAQVRERFGAGAYIEWRWMHEDGAWGTLVSTDPHLSQGGMWYTVGPADVLAKTTFEASLVVP